MHDIWIEDSPLIDKVSQEPRSQITKKTEVSFWNDNNKLEIYPNWVVFCLNRLSKRLLVFQFLLMMFKISFFEYNQRNIFNQNCYLS